MITVLVADVDVFDFSRGRRRAVLLGLKDEARVDERREALVSTDYVRAFVRGTLGATQRGSDPREELHGAVRGRALPRGVQEPVPVHRR